MADGKVRFEIEAGSKGNSLKKTADQTKKLGNEVKKTGTNFNNASNQAGGFHKVEKSMYTTTLNGTKAFSKQAQSIGGGSSGLVGAYATLAANVFAASAAFQFLTNAARFDILSKGLQELGNQSGRTLSIVANNLREVTGSAISVEESFRSAALGISGGFGQEELAGLAKVARGASVALGRDLGDAFDRLTRGAIKLEPEILDELGIMVRLDDAVENYAVVLGKSATQLSQLERRQAFMNAILEQGEIKFGNIAEKVDNNPYDRLSAAFRDLTKNIGAFANVTIIPFVEVLANNVGLLIGSSLLLASTFAKQMIPGLLQGGAAAQKAASRLSELAIAKNKVATEAAVPGAASLSGDVGTKETRDEIKLIKASNGQRKVKLGIIKQLERSEKSYNTQINSKKAFGIKLTDKQIAQKKAKLALTQQEIVKLKALRDVQITGFTSSFAGDSADIRGMLSGSIGGILEGQQGRSSFESLKELPNDFKKLGEESKAAFKLFGDSSEKLKGAGFSAKFFSGGLEKIKLSATTAAGGIRIFGSALLNAIPFLGLIVIGVTSLIALYKNMTFDAQQEKLNEALKDYETILDGVSGKTEEYNRILEKVESPFLKITQSFTVASGLIDETITSLDKVLKLQQEIANQPPAKNFLGATTDTFANLSQGANASGFTAENYKAEVLKRSQEFSDILNTELEISGKLRKDLSESPVIKTLLTLREEGPQIVNDILDNTLDLDEVIKGGDSEEILNAVTKALRETQKSLKDTGPALKGLESSFKESEKVFSQFLNNAFPKTKWDETTKAIKSTNIELKAALQEIGKAYGEDLSKNLQDLDFSAYSQELQIQLASAISGTGTTLSKFLDPEFAGAGKKLENALQNSQRIREDITKQEKDMEGLTGQAAQNAEKRLLTAMKALEASDAQVDSAQLLNQRRGTALTTLETDLENLQETARTLKSNNDIIANRIKLLSKTVKFGDALQYSLEQQNEIHKANSKQLEDEIKYFQTIYDNSVEAGKADIETLQFLNKLKADKKKIDDSILTVAEINLKVQRANIKLAQEELKISKELSASIATQAENEIKLQNYRKGVGLELQGQNSFELELEAAKEKRRLAIEEAEIRLSLLDVEAEVTKARLLVLAAELRKGGDEAGAAKLESAAGRATENIGKARAAIVSTISSIRSTFETEITQAFTNSLSDTNMGFVFENLAKVVAERSGNVLKAELTKAGEEAYNKIINAGGTVDAAEKAKNDAITTAENDPNSDPNKAAEKARDLSLGDVKSILTPMTEELKKLGPEGEYVAAATAGIFSIADAFSALQGGALTAGEAVQAATQIMSAVNSTMQAYSKQRIAEIDKQIEAEQKRDGKSQQSVNKIKQMQKKKDEIGKKAFEMDKKMKIASAVMNTAAGIMQAYANYEPLTATVLSAMIGALGAAQIGIIKKTQYQSTATDTTSASNTALTIGKRSTNVDVSQNATSGELNYLRGGRTDGTNLGGAGGAMGRKGYANGGEGIVVGERGPEIVSPSAPVDITPNFALGGGETNVNFTINAVDATGVEDLLINQRGNLIRMIREAANENGEEFLPTIDPMAYGSKT